ncbi:MAG: hypothetical protein ACT4QG_08915 [Sporichthyaceae bacterium]
MGAADAQARGRATWVGGLAVLAIAGLAVAPASAQDQAELTMTGQSFGIAVLSDGLLTPASVPGPDTGEIETTSAGDYDAPCAVERKFGLGSAHALCARFGTTPAVDGAIARASAAEVKMTIAQIGEISLFNVQSESMSQCAGSKGASSVGVLNVAGQTFPIGALKPNTVFDLGDKGDGAKAHIVFNEQIQEAGELTVNAARLVVTGGGAGSTDVVIASSRSGVQNCMIAATPAAPQPIAPAAPGPAPAAPGPAPAEAAPQPAQAEAAPQPAPADTAPAATAPAAPAEAPAAPAPAEVAPAQPAPAQPAPAQPLPGELSYYPPML